MFTGYVTALPPSAALPPVDVAFTVDANLLGIALVAALASAAVMLVVRARASGTDARPEFWIRSGRTSPTSRRAA
jgi:hypothetical protein